MHRISPAGSTLLLSCVGVRGTDQKRNYVANRPIQSGASKASIDGNDSEAADERVVCSHNSFVRRRKGFQARVWELWSPFALHSHSSDVIGRMIAQHQQKADYFPFIIQKYGSEN